MRSNRHHNRQLRRLSRSQWVVAGTKALVSGGIGNVVVEKVARGLNVTKGSFYWHFHDRRDFLDAMVAHWTERNLTPFKSVLDTDTDNPIRQYSNFCEIWLDPERFDPLLDSAMREWGRTDARVSGMVKQADALRIALLTSIFSAIGYDPVESEVRARITYYHQVGYYLLDLRESAEQRRRLFPHYYRVLAGLPVPPPRTPGSQSDA